MIPEFEKLSSDERALMYDVIPLTTILIASADGKIDDKEIEWAKKVAHIRSYTYEDQLKDYYLHVGTNYEDRLNEIREEYGQNTDQTVASISKKLEEVNDILPKLDYIFGRKLHDSWKSFARHVARATGGILGFNKMQKAEKELIELPMIQEL